jgi:hypothetical protein
MPTRQTSVAAYLKALPLDRRAAISAVRDVILANLPKGYEERMDRGMISYVVPLATYPETYNGEALAYASLASQKSYMSLYLMGVYGDRESDFRQRFEATGKKLNMGKSCLRFKKLEDLPLDVIGKEIKRLPVKKFIAQYEDARTSSRRTG